MLRRQLILMIFNMFSSQRDDSQTRGLYPRARKFGLTSSRHSATHRRACFLLQKQHKVSVIGPFWATIFISISEKSSMNKVLNKQKT